MSHNLSAVAVGCGGDSIKNKNNENSETIVARWKQQLLAPPNTQPFPAHSNHTGEIRVCRPEELSPRGVSDPRALPW